MTDMMSIEIQHKITVINKTMDTFLVDFPSMGPVLRLIVTGMSGSVNSWAAPPVRLYIEYPSGKRW